MFPNKNITRSFQKRTVRALYGNASMLPGVHSLDRDDLRDRHIIPGMVATKTAYGVTICGHMDKPIGIFSNWVGGELDELGDSNEIGLWGDGAILEILNDKNVRPILYSNWQTGTILYSGSLGYLIDGPFSYRSESVGVVDNIFGPDRIVMTVKIGNNEDVLSGKICLY